MTTSSHSPRRPASPAVAGERLLVAVLGLTALLLGTLVVILLVRQSPPASSEPLPHDPPLVAVREPEQVVEPRSHDPSATAALDAGDGDGTSEAVGAEPALAATGKVATVGRPTATAPRLPARPASTVAGVPPARPTGASACPCPPDDLMCNMRCSVRK